MHAAKSWVGHMNRPTTFLAVYVFFFLQERLQYIAEFSRKPHLSTMLDADTNQTATNIAEQMFSIYRHDLCV